ncbi:unnamed protein product [Somion occarium]|uniref:RING-type domain-containing protein n=1 Tax=Somion occarium TaxID=3059160 RepID=A0ABP1CIN1_9APHY
MSTREPLWYCHECHAEMRPLMVPDPHCASCNGTFVEKLENPADDPRAYRGGGMGDEDMFGPADFIFGLSSLLNAGGVPPSQNRSGPSAGAGQGQTLGGSGGNATRSSGGNGGGFTIRIDRTGNGPARTVITGGAPRSDNNGGNGAARIPLLSEFIQRAPQGGQGGPDHETINGPLMFQYLLAMLSQGRNGGTPGVLPGMFPPGAEGGRWGDYVFNQEALDQIITQLMENSQSHPVPATEEIMQKLPREVLTEESPLLERDCAVCKDQFQLNTDDPAEQVVVTLPCSHPFHEPCIIPWLKSSGTCPVCRYELVPQPQHGSNNNPGGSNVNDSQGPDNPSGGSNNSQNQNQNNNPGVFANLFNLVSGYSNNNGHSSNTGQNNNAQHSSSGSSQSRRGIPGSWEEDVD